MKKFLKVGAISVSILSVIVVSYLGLCVVLNKVFVPSQGVSSTTIVTQPVEDPVTQDPALVGVANNLGINVAKLNLIYNPNVESDNVEDTSGSFMGSRTIQIKPGLSIEKTQRIMAHEYMHFVWRHLPEEEKASLTLMYKTWMVKDPWLQDRLSSYHNCDDRCMANEAIAYTCTEVQPRDLSAEFNNYCYRHIKNRNILFQ